MEQINKTRSWFFERSNKIDEPLASLIKNKREKILINKIMNEKGEITTNTKEIQTILKTYIYIFIYDSHTEREREREKGRDLGRGRSRLHAGSLMWDSFPGLQDHSLG